MGFSVIGAQSASLVELVEAAQAETSDNSTAMCEIVRRFEQTACKLARRLTPDPWVQQDIANAARYAVVTAVRAHSPEIPGFASYVALTMRGEAQRAFGRAIAIAEINTEADAAVWNQTRNHIYQPAVQVETDLAVMTAPLSAEQRELVFQRYVLDAPLADIADMRGGTVSSLSHRFKTIHRVVLQGFAANAAVAA